VAALGCDTISRRGSQTNGFTFAVVLQDQAETNQLRLFGPQTTTQNKQPTTSRYITREAPDSALDSDPFCKYRPHPNPSAYRAVLISITVAMASSRTKRKASELDKDTNLWMSVDVKLSKKFNVYPLKLRNNIKSGIQGVHPQAYSYAGKSCMWELVVLRSVTPIDQNRPVMAIDDCNEVSAHTFTCGSGICEHGAKIARAARGNQGQDSGVRVKQEEDDYYHYYDRTDTTTSRTSSTWTATT
jgi:hypothetical protein